MKRNGLYAIIAVLAVVVGVLGYKVYQDQQRSTGIDIRIGEQGVSVETN